jgi:hypothetical protein
MHPLLGDKGYLRGIHFSFWHFVTGGVLTFPNLGVADAQNSRICVSGFTPDIGIKIIT